MSGRPDQADSGGKDPSATSSSRRSIPISDGRRAYRRRARRASRTNAARAAKCNNGYKMAIDRKEELLRERGWRTLRHIFRRINQTGTGMRQLYRLRSGDDWGYFGRFLRAFDAYDICTAQEVRVREANYQLYLDSIRRYVQNRDGGGLLAEVPRGEDPRYIQAPIFYSEDEDDGGSTSFLRWVRRVVH